MQKFKIILRMAVSIFVLASVPIAAAKQAEQARAVGQSATAAEVIARPRPFTTARQAELTITIDGALDEASWEQAEPLTGFVQAEPLEGQPASESTVVRLLYDDEAIYVGVLLEDSDPSRIIVTDTSRDADLGQMDSFQVIFDTFHDYQNGFVFGTNAAGAEFDAQVRSQGSLDESWDASWDVKTQRLKNGWCAEFRIPLRTLRYGPAPQNWGVNFMRNIHRRRERAYWAPLPRTYDLSRLSSAGDLRGLELRSPRNFKVLPYVTASANRNYAPGSETVRRGEWGADAKIGLTGSMNLDLTYNTDFAQVEVDDEQINLTRFNLRFPEKRPFFLENAGLFTVGQGSDLDLFFSRRIGIGEGGSLVPIKGGARLSGKAGGFNVGMLNIQTEQTGETPANNFSTLRVSRDLPSRSGLGAIFVNRTVTGSLAGTDDWNRTYGLDGRVGLGERLTVTGFAARTGTPGRDGREYAYNTSSEYDDGQHRVFFDYGLTGEDFNPEAGFVRKTGGYRRMRMGWYETMRQPYIREMGFREFLPHISYTRFDYLDGAGIQNAEMHVDNHFDWENGYFISPALNTMWEGLDEPFEVFPGVVVPPGDYTSPRLTLRINTDRRKWLFGRIQWDIGGFLSGDQNTILQEVIVRQGGKFAVDTTWKRSDITLPQGEFVTNLGNMRVTYNFTPSVFAQSLIQYNDRTDRWSTNLRFHWLSTAGTGFFIVYNNTESLNGLGPVNRAFIIKYVRQFDMLN